MSISLRSLLSEVLKCRELGGKGVNSLLAVPVSFVSEHIETLEEIDMEYRELAHESGIRNWGRVPALNTNPVFIDDLAEAVLEALPYVGSMAGSNPSDAMVPLGELHHMTRNSTLSSNVHNSHALLIICHDSCLQHSHMVQTDVSIAIDFGSGHLLICSGVQVMCSLCLRHTTEIGVCFLLQLCPGNGVGQSQLRPGTGVLQCLPL